MEEKKDYTKTIGIVLIVFAVLFFIGLNNY